MSHQLESLSENLLYSRNTEAVRQKLLSSAVTKVILQAQSLQSEVLETILVWLALRSEQINSWWVGRLKELLKSLSLLLKRDCKVPRSAVSTFKYQ